MSGFWEYLVLRAARSTHGDERGAAALEFALIAPVLLLILFGVLGWGLWLNDGMNLRQGVREASRQGVVNSFGSTSSCGATYATTPSSDIQNLVCQTKSASRGITGKTYVKVALPAGWHRGDNLVVCSMINSDRIPSIVPLPNGGWIKASSQMAIEVANQGQVETGGAEALPAGADWSWCT